MMNSQDQETLSALLDNEADELELRRILKKAAAESELLDAWQRMSLVQAVLHDDNLKVSRHLNVPGPEFSAVVMQAIEQEPLPGSGAGSFGDHADDYTGQTRGVVQWTRPLAKLGIAASVALAFFLGMQTAIYQPDSGANAPIAQQLDAGHASETDASATLVASSIESTPREVDPEARQRLEEYIQSVSITRDEPPQLVQPQYSPLYRLVNENPDQQ